jgi:ribosomal protein S18 acetylase RimI-like enzyme
MIRPFVETDVAAFQALRLRALTEEPEAFGSSPDDFAHLSLPAVVQRFRQTNDAFVLGAWMPELGSMPGLERLLLHVVTTNTTAIGLYRSLGFITYGIERHALKLGHRHIDEELMTLTFV